MEEFRQKVSDIPSMKYHTKLEEKTGIMFCSDVQVKRLLGEELGNTICYILGKINLLHLNINKFLDKENPTYKEIKEHIEIVDKVSLLYHTMILLLD
jgi:hypothetical protein